MKTFFIILLLTVSAKLSTKAQTAEKSRIKVVYRFTHIRDTTKRDKPYTEDLTLLAGRSASAYRSLDGEKQEQLRNQEVQDQVKHSADPNAVNLVLTGSRPVSETEYYQFIAKQKLYTCYKMNNSYLTEEPLPAITWKISPETMSVQGFQCQKATAHYRGRDYVAWFCSDFSLQAGPWKLNGLPGLILQAEDSKKEVVFQCVSVADVSKENLVISLPKEAVKATRKDIDRLIDLQRKDPAAYAKIPSAKISGALGDLDPSRIQSIRVNSPSVKFGKAINNPIELPEK